MVSNKNPIKDFSLKKWLEQLEAFALMYVTSSKKLETHHTSAFPI